VKLLNGSVVEIRRPAASIKRDAVVTGALIWGWFESLWAPFRAPIGARSPLVLTPQPSSLGQSSCSAAFVFERCGSSMQLQAAGLKSEPCATKRPSVHV
jgi:hypothetical protein